jgi:hypothetical protein
MPFSNFESKLTSLDDFIIEFIPQFGCCKLRARESSQRAEHQTIADKCNTIKERSTAKEEHNIQHHARSSWSLNQPPNVDEHSKKDIVPLYFPREVNQSRVQELVLTERVRTPGEANE